MKTQTAQNKAETVFIAVKNVHTSSVSRGVPVCFKMSGTDDGFEIIDANTGAAAKSTPLFAGILAQTLATNAKGLSQVYGFNLYTVVTRMTRAASTDSYASCPAIAIGDVMNVDTVANGMSRSATLAASAFLPFCMAAETIASSASSASTSSDSSTAKTTNVKTFIRAL